MAAVKFSKQYIHPNPLEVDYWVDLSKNPYGSIIKYYNGEDWVQLNGSGGSASDFDFYTKTLINLMLSKKADVTSVESKVDDAELAEVIKNIDVQDVGDNTLQLVIFKYDNTRIALTLPTATATNPGILSGSDFVNFVKQHQLQSLYTEMYDLFADIRSKYQLKLTAGNNIVIDKINNTISVSDDIKIDWDRIRSKPNFHKVSTSGDYWDLKNKLTAGFGIEINDANKIGLKFGLDHELYLIVEELPTEDINPNKVYILVSLENETAYVYSEYIYTEEGWKHLRSYKASIDLRDILSKTEAEKTYVTYGVFDNTLEEIQTDVDLATDTSIEFSKVANQAMITADAAKNAVSTLEGLSNVDTSTIVAANVITQVEQNTLKIQQIESNEILLTEAEYEALEVKDPTKKYYIYEE